MAAGAGGDAILVEDQSQASDGVTFFDAVAVFSTAPERYRWNFALPFAVGEGEGGEAEILVWDLRIHWQELAAPN